MARPTLSFRKITKSNQRRRRALTPPFTPILNRPYSTTFYPQTQCMLLYNLPYELRLEIYKEVLGNEPVMMESANDWYGFKNKKNGTRKPPANKKDARKSSRTDQGRQDSMNDAHGEDGQSENTGNLGVKSVMALMKSCRLAYTELHPLFLAHHVSIPTITTFDYFLECIPTTHHHFITTITLHTYLPYLLFPVRQIPSQNSWMRRTVKQLQHFDVPAWNFIWGMLAGGGGLALTPATSAASESSSSPRKPSVSSIIGGGIGPLPGLPGLRHLHVTITARDYTTFHNLWPQAPDDMVAELLWDPILACARARGWPHIWPTSSQRRASRNMPIMSAAAVMSDTVSTEPGPFIDWTITVSWPITVEKYGKGRPPEKLYLDRDEMKAGLPFRLISDTGLAKVGFTGTPRFTGPPGTGFTDPDAIESETDSSHEDRDSGEGSDDDAVASSRDTDQGQLDNIEEGIDRNRNTHRQWWET